MKIIKLFFFLLVNIYIVKAFSTDSLYSSFEKNFNLFPEYYMRLDASFFALHKDVFFKRQYLAEPHAYMEFYLLKYKNLISFLTDIDFQFGLGEVPGNIVFTVLNVSFGYEPSLELNLKYFSSSFGLTHRCFHEIDRSDFPLVYWNKINLRISSLNSKMHFYRNILIKDSLFTTANRFSWQVEFSYYIKEFFNLVSSEKLNGNNPLISEINIFYRYAFYKRRSWIFLLFGESTIGNFSHNNGYYVKNKTNWFWREALGLEVYYIKSLKAAAFFVKYNLDDLPVEPNSPSFTLGNSRFSRDKLLEFGIRFFN